MARAWPIWATAAALATVVAGATTSAQQGDPTVAPARVFTALGEGLYRVDSGAGTIRPVSMVQVTGQGIVLVDANGTEFATWLKAELARRFAVPVRYVVYSHYHWDHAKGGSVFADTAEFVAHEHMVRSLHNSLAVPHPPGESWDRNGNDVIDREEAHGGTRDQFDRFDSNGDGLLSRGEITADIPAPTVLVADRMALMLGGKTVELIHREPSRDGILDVRFPDAGVLFVGDYVWPKRLTGAWTFDRTPLPTWIDTLRAMELLDFEILVPSHGYASGTKQDLVAYRWFLEDLTAAVQAGIHAGRSVEELKSSIRLDAYRHWADYDRLLERNIEAAYSNLRRSRW